MSQDLTNLSRPVNMCDMEITRNTQEPGWENYRERIYGKSVTADWMLQNIIEPARERLGDPTIAPWDKWRVVKIEGGLQAQVRRSA